MALRRKSAARVEDREIAIPADFRLESGDALEDGCIRLRRVGAADAPQVVALGGISAGRDVSGESGWWRHTIADQNAIDTDEFGLIGFDFAPLNDQRVRITPHDQARLIALALDAVGVARLHAFVGASYGGQVGLAFGALAPERVERLCVLSAAHKAAIQSLAWRGVQRRVVEFALEQGKAEEGLSLARQLAMVTYRTPDEFEERFAPGVDADGRGEVDRYLESRGSAYVNVSAPQRWLSLSEAIDRFSVEPATINVPTTLVACASDQLVPIAHMRELAERLPRLSAFHTISSLYGHDAFLKEPERVATIISQFLKEAAHG